jgi:hypothetical protein
MRRSMVLLATALLLASASLAMADTVTISSIVDGWSNPVCSTSPASNCSLVITNQNNPGTDSIRWGTPAGGTGQSGYDWNSQNVPVNVTTGTTFSLGTFSHINEPISSGTAITSVDLDFQLGNFQSPSTLGATFLFTHDETPNDPAQCPNDPNPCPDIVTISNAFFNTPFTYNGNNYFFTLLGFSTNGGSTISSQFVTQENAINNADLYAVITTDRLSTVPEPASLTLFATGLAMTGFVGWRKRKK